MTCIVGVVERGVVYLAGDSAGVAGYGLTLRRDPKVFRNGEFVLGFTSSFRMGQLLQHAFTPPAIEEPLDRYMVTPFVNALRACFKDGGYAAKNREQEEGGTFLVGVRGRLYQVEDDYQVGEARADYAAIGCGAQVALGALHVTAGHPPGARLRLALEAAEAWNAGVRGPFVTCQSDPPLADPAERPFAEIAESIRSANQQIAALLPALAAAQGRIPHMQATQAAAQQTLDALPATAGSDTSASFCGCWPCLVAYELRGAARSANCAAQAFNPPYMRLRIADAAAEIAQEPESPIGRRRCAFCNSMHPVVRVTKSPLGCVPWCARCWDTAVQLDTGDQPAGPGVTE
jgi:hypothetical protein